MNILKGLPKRTDYLDDLNTMNDNKSKYYYNAIEASASAYFQSSYLIRRLFYKRLEVVMKLIDKKRYNFTLDAGTGVGILLPYLSRTSKKVKAIDYSDIIDYARFMCKRKRITNVLFEKADLNEIKEDKKYDLIVCLSVLEHIENPEQVFAKFNNILNKGGILIVGYPIEGKIIKVIRYVESVLRGNIDKKIRKHGYEKTKEFTGHISNWRKIDKAMKRYFKINKKIDLSFCLIKYYAIRKAYKNEN